MVLTASFVLSPVTGLFCHRHLQVTTCKLDTSVGVSGPHDFTVREKHRSPCTPEARNDTIASTAFRAQRFVTMAIRPSSGPERGKVVKVICPTAQAKYFSQRGLDSPNQLEMLRQIAFLAQR